MNRTPLRFFGVLALFCAAWWGLVAVPYRQLSGLEPHVDADSGVRQPVARSGAAMQGAEVYRSLGCAACHTQQVRSTNGAAGDLARGWGLRRSVARDYIYDETVQLGSQRLGPDLANYGLRLGTNPVPLVRLYAPRAVVSNSLCAPSPFLFRKQKVMGGTSTNALALSGRHAVESGWEVVPERGAEQLAAYLHSLRCEYALPEAPLSPKPEGVTP